MTGILVFANPAYYYYLLLIFARPCHLKHNFIYLFIYSCVGSWLLRGLFSSCGEQGLPLQLWHAGFSSQRLLLLWSAGSRAHGLR